MGDFLDKVLIPNWRAAWKMYSIWIFAIIALTPDLFNLAVSMGVISAEEAPKELSRAINLIGFFGAAARLLKQKTIEIEAQQPEPKPGE